MPLKLRLRRMGRKKRPIYAVVAADSRSPRDGRFIEDLGRYNPIEEPVIVDLKDERILYWLDQGAQPTETVRNLLSKQGLLLGASLRRKGRPEEDVQAAIQQHREARAAKTSGIKITAAQRRQQALEAERKRVAEAEAEAARQRAEADAEAKRQAEEAKRREAEERLAAQENAELPAPAPVEEPVAPENNAGPNEVAEEEEPQAATEMTEGEATEASAAETVTAASAPEATAAEGGEPEAAKGDEEAEEEEPKA